MGPVDTKKRNTEYEEYLDVLAGGIDLSSHLEEYGAIPLPQLFMPRHQPRIWLLNLNIDLMPFFCGKSIFLFSKN